MDKALLTSPKDNRLSGRGNHGRDDWKRKGWRLVVDGGWKEAVECGGWRMAVEGWRLVVDGGLKVGGRTEAVEGGGLEGDGGGGGAGGRWWRGAGRWRWKVGVRDGSGRWGLEDAGGGWGGGG
jgi:hypothetical protein